MPDGEGRPQDFGSELRAWRKARGLSQEEVSRRASYSTRHISFLETGRSAPSRAAVLRLGSALEIPLRDRNRMLRAAGHAAVYPDREETDGGRERVRSVLEFVQRRHEPYPCYVVDRLWTVETCNTAGEVLLERLLGRRRPEEVIGTNLLRLLFHPEGLRPHVVNLDQLRRLFTERLERLAARRPSAPELRELLSDLESYGNRPAPREGPSADLGQPVVPVRLRHEGGELRLLSTVMTVGEPRDVALEELRLETFFPLDGPTDETLLRWRNDEAAGDRAPFGAGLAGGGSRGGVTADRAGDTGEAEGAP